jgi:adenylosuccinate lyase
MIERYTRPQMGALFTEQYKFDTWLKVELAVCDAWAAQGDIPRPVAERIRHKARFELRRINEIEAQVHHDVIAFTTAVGDYIGADSAYFHKGLTSSDVVDTAQSLVLKQAGQLLEEGLVALKDTLGRRAVEHRLTPVMGRTHGVHAEPTTFGLKLLIWYDELQRHEERLAAAIDNIAVGKLSGAVGNFAHIPPHFEEAVLKKLGLRPAPVSNQVVQRDRHAQFVCALALLGATLEKIAINLRTMQRTEIGEAQEPFAAGQKGSSAMPHKKNPILLERVTGLARVLRGYAVTALENVALWDERDISHSGAERVILPDACILMDYMLAKLKGVIESLEVHAERMERNIYMTKGLIFSQRVLLALAQAGMSREAAYAIVQHAAMRCWQDGMPLLDVLLADREVRAVLPAPQISALFTLEPYLAHAEEIFERVGLTTPAKPAATAHTEEAQRRSRGRRGGRAVQAKRAKSATPGLPLSDGGAVQNISERPSEWYETASVRGKQLPPPIDQVDETLGESDHQRDARQKRGAKRQAGAASRGAAPRGRGRAAAPAEAPVATHEPPAPVAVATPPAAVPEADPAAKPAPKTRSRRAVKPAEAPAAVPEAAPAEAVVAEDAAPKKRSRGTRGGRGRKKNGAGETASAPPPINDGDDSYVD